MASKKSTPSPVAAASPLGVPPADTSPWDGLSLDQQTTLEDMCLENIKAVRFCLRGSTIVAAHWPDKFERGEPVTWDVREDLMFDAETVIMITRDGKMWDMKGVEVKEGPPVEDINGPIESRGLDEARDGGVPAPSDPPELAPCHELPLAATDAPASQGFDPALGGVDAIATAGLAPHALLGAATDVGAAAPLHLVQTSAVMEVALGEIFPSALNPRKRFDQAKLEEMAKSIRGKGIISPLIVRAVLPLGDRAFEIIAGECRWRAAALAGLSVVPVLVRPMTDADALEVMLIENMQRRDLSALEECDAFARALSQRDEHGALVYASQQALADKIGIERETVTLRLSLLKLPAEGRAALETEQVSYRILRRVCAAPSALVPRLVDTVLHPRKWPLLARRAASVDDALSLEEVEELIEHLSMDISRAPFDLADAALVPLKTRAPAFGPESGVGERLEGGACIGCEFNTATSNKDRHPKCLLPACYKKKVEVHVQAALVRAKAAGATILPDSEASLVLHGGAHKGVNPDYVELEKKIDPDDRAPAVSDRNAPTWAEVVTAPAGGVKATDIHNLTGERTERTVIAEGAVLVPVLVAVDADGRVRQFARKTEAVAAAEKTGQAPMLSLGSGRGTSLQTSEAKAAEKQRAAEKAAAEKRRREVSYALMDKLTSAIEEDGVALEVWPKLLGLAVRHAGNSGCAFVAKRRELEGASGPEIEKYAKGLKLSAKVALVFELLLAQDFAAALQGSMDAPIAPDYLAPVLKEYAVTEKSAEREVAAAEKVAAATKSAAAVKKDGKDNTGLTQRRKGAKKTHAQAVREALVGSVVRCVRAKLPTIQALAVTLAELLPSIPHGHAVVGTALDVLRAEGAIGCTHEGEVIDGVPPLPRYWLLHTEGGAK